MLTHHSPAAAAFTNWKGQPGQTYWLLTDGSGARLRVTLGQGGRFGNGVFVRSMEFKQGRNAAMGGALTKLGSAWFLTGGRHEAAAGWAGGRVTGFKQQLSLRRSLHRGRTGFAFLPTAPYVSTEGR